MTRTATIRAACVAAIAALAWIGAAAAQSPVATEDTMIHSADPGIDLFVRNKHPAGVTENAPDRILLFVHGATYPAETAFDLPLRG